MQKRLLGLLAAGVMIVTACGGSTSSASPAASTPAESPAASASGEPSASASPAAELADDQTLRVTLGSEDPDTLDPSKASTSTSIGVLHALNRGLLYVDKDLNVIPSLAEGMPEISADGLTYTFKLRDAKYSNGDPIVAADLVYAWRRLLDPTIASQYQAIIQDVKGAQALIDMTGKDPAATPAEIKAAQEALGVAAPDEKTFVVTLEHPTGYFTQLATLWNTAPIPQKWAETPNAFDAPAYVSSGPFMLKSWTHQAEIVLVPNPNWYGTKPTIQTLQMKIGGDPTANQASFEAGELDMLAASPPDVPRIKGDAELGPLVTTQPTLIFDYWGFWTKDGPTANKHLRRALSMAIDKDTMMATVYGGQGLVAGSPIPPGMPGHQPDLGLKYDVTAAKAELATALQELGLSDVSQLPVLSFGFNTDAGHEITAAYMQGQWQDNLGVKTELKGETFDLFSKDRPKGVFSIARNAWGADYPHPDNILRVLFKSDSGNNDEGYNNPEYDKLIDQAGTEPDLTKAVALYNQAQALLVEDAPAVYTRWRISNYEIRPWVQGVQGTAQDSVVIGDYFYENISIAKH